MLKVDSKLPLSIFSTCAPLRFVSRHISRHIYSLPIIILIPLIPVPSEILLLSLSSNLFNFLFS